MDQELWNRVENKRNLIKLVSRNEEEFARKRIARLREMLCTDKELQQEDVKAAGQDDKLRRLQEQVATLQEELVQTRGELAAARNLSPQPVDTDGASVADSIQDDEPSPDQEGDYVELVCPADLSSDRELTFELPDGRCFEIVVPHEVDTGEAFLAGPF